MRTRVLSLLAVSCVLPAQEPADPRPSRPSVLIERGTHIPLSLIISVSTKQSAPGDRVYLESVFPIMVNGRIVIPPGSYVMGTVTQVKRPGRVRGRGELYVRFDSLTLPNGVTRDFRGRIDTLDGRSTDAWTRRRGRSKANPPRVTMPARLANRRRPESASALSRARPPTVREWALESAQRPAQRPDWSACF